MNFYRIFFESDGRIVSHHEFYAEREETVAKAAEVVFEACSEVCDKVEVWNGARLVTSVRASPLKPSSGKADGGPEEPNSALARAKQVSEKMIESLTSAGERLGKTDAGLSVRLQELSDELAIGIDQAVSAADWRFRGNPRLRARLAGSGAKSGG